MVPGNFYPRVAGSFNCLRFTDNVLIITDEEEANGNAYIRAHIRVHSRIYRMTINLNEIKVITMGGVRKLQMALDDRELCLPRLKTDRDREIRKEGKHIG